MIDFILGLLRKPQSIFVAKIIFSWYAMIMVPAIYATYYFFSGLEKSGVLSLTYNFIRSKIEMSVDIAKDCTPLIMNLGDLFSCVANH